MQMAMGTDTFFGVPLYGVHVNGIVRGDNGVDSIWVARRSSSKVRSSTGRRALVAGAIVAAEFDLTSHGRICWSYRHSSRIPSPQPAFLRLFIRACLF